MKRVESKKKFIIFFYESHSNSTPTKLIQKLLNLFKDLNIKALAIENPMNRDPLEHVSNLVQKAKTAIDYENLKELEKNFSKSINQNEINRYINHLYYSENKSLGIDKEFRDLTLQDKQYLFSGIIKFIENTFEAQESLLELIQSCRTIGIEPFNMDISIEDREHLIDTSLEEQVKYRDNIMVKNILDKAMSVNGIVVLVGADHNNIAKIIKEKSDYLVKEYFVDCTGNIERPLYRSFQKDELDGLYYDASKIDVNDATLNSYMVSIRENLGIINNPTTDFIAQTSNIIKYVTLLIGIYFIYSKFFNDDSDDQLLTGDTVFIPDEL